MTYPGLGGQQPPPQNAAPAGQLVPGVQPGVTGQIVASRVIIIGSGGELLVYSPSAGAGNLIASIAGMATTDPYGNAVLAGITAYTTVGGDRIAVELGLGSFAGSPAAGLFTHDVTSPATSDPFAGSLGNGTAVLYSGQSTALAVGSGVEAEDSVVSGVANGEVTLVGGAVLVQGVLTVNGTPLTVNGSTHTTINGVSSPGTVGTSGPASAGTAHTHSAGSYTLGSGAHQHSSFGG